jgi:hypothetical protein
MTKILPVLALLAVVACRAEFEPDIVGPGPGPGPQPTTPSIPFRVGSLQPDEGRAVAVGAFGDVLVASWFAGPTDFDPSPGVTSRPSFGQQDLAVASYTASGEFRWVYNHGGAGADIPVAMASTADGGAVVVGYSDGGGTCGGRTLVSFGGRDILVLKLSSAGTCEWGHLIGSDQEDEATAVTIEAGGTVLVTGVFRGTVDFDPGTGARLLVSRGGSDAFLARYGADGTFLDVVQGGGLGEDAFTAVATAQNGEITVAGTLTGVATFGAGLSPVILQAQSGTDGVLARYTPLLGLRWADLFAATGDVRLAAVANEPDGSIILYGSFAGSLDADPGTGAVLLQSEGGSDLFVGRYDGGSGVWSSMARRIGGPGDEGATALVRSPSGNLTMAGWFQQAVDFDPGAGASLVTARGTAGAGDAFVASLDPLGNFRWVTPIGAVVTGEEALTIAWGLAGTSNGTVWVTGRFTGRADFDPSTEATELQSLGGSDQFVSRYSAAGSLIP